MMLFNLIKKDILIVKKYVLIMFAAAVLIPPFMLWRAPEFTGVLGFMLSVIFCVLMLVQYVCLKEYQFPKAATLLCATPFSRRMLVLSKYIFCIAVYVACCVIYAIDAVLIPALGTIDVTMFFLMLLVTSAFIGVYLPVQYKFVNSFSPPVQAFIGVYLPVQYKLGYEKTKFIFMVVMLASPIILPQLMRMEMLNLNFLSVFSPLFICGGALVVSLIILSASVVLSMKFYSEADLA